MCRRKYLQRERQTTQATRALYLYMHMNRTRIIGKPFLTLDRPDQSYISALTSNQKEEPSQRHLHEDDEGRSSRVGYGTQSHYDHLGATIVP